jgi:hypothetical protein
LQLTNGKRPEVIFLTLSVALIRIKELTFTAVENDSKFIQVLGSFRLGDCHQAIVETTFPSTFFVPVSKQNFTRFMPPAGVGC